MPHKRIEYISHEPMVHVNRGGKPSSRPTTSLMDVLYWRREQETVMMTLHAHCSAMYTKGSLHNLTQVYKVGVSTGF